MEVLATDWGRESFFDGAGSCWEIWCEIAFKSWECLRLTLGEPIGEVEGVPEAGGVPESGSLFLEGNKLVEVVTVKGGEEEVEDENYEGLENLTEEQKQ